MPPGPLDPPILPQYLSVDSHMMKAKSLHESPLSINMDILYPILHCKYRPLPCMITFNFISLKMHENQTGFLLECNQYNLISSAAPPPPTHTQTATHPHTPVPHPHHPSHWSHIADPQIRFPDLGVWYTTMGHTACWVM